MTSRCWTRRSIGAAPFALFLVLGCDGPVGPPGPEGTSVGGGQGPGVPYESLNLVSVHDPIASGYDADCFKCHGDMSDGTTLLEGVQEIHVRMVPAIVKDASGADIPEGEVNARCLHCHDRGAQVLAIEGRSAANLRRQVPVAICADCHRPGGPSKQLYQ